MGPANNYTKNMTFCIQNFQKFGILEQKCVVGRKSVARQLLKLFRPKAEASSRLTLKVYEIDNGVTDGKISAHQK